MHVCSFDANRLCMLEEKTLKNDFENFPPLNVTESFCAGLGMTFDNENKRQILHKLLLFSDHHLA